MWNVRIKPSGIQTILNSKPENYISTFQGWIANFVVDKECKKIFLILLKVKKE